MAGLRKALDGAGHDALLMIDCIACLGVDAFEMDAWGVDVMVTGSQKGLMTPPGMAFVFASEKAERARAAMDRVSSHWDWSRGSLRMNRRSISEVPRLCITSSRFVKR